MTNKPTKAEREAESRAQAFAAQASRKPVSTDLTHLDTLRPGVAPAPAIDTAPVHVQRARPIRPALPPAREAPPPKEAAPPVAPAAPAPVAAPWDSAHPKLTVPYQLRMPQQLHMQVAWLADHLPRTSMHSLMIEAVEQQVRALLAEHYAPPDQK